MRAGLAGDAWQCGVRFNCMVGTSSITFKRTSWRGSSSAAADAEAAVATEEQPNAAAARSRPLSKRELHICL